MIIRKECNSCAAHRNEELADKCRNLHGQGGNMAYMLFGEITELGFRLGKLEIRETDTLVGVYIREDWVADNRYFAKKDNDLLQIEVAS